MTKMLAVTNPSPQFIVGALIRKGTEGGKKTNLYLPRPSSNKTMFQLEEEQGQIAPRTTEKNGLLLKVMIEEKKLSFFFLHVLPVNIVSMSCAKRLRFNRPIAKAFPNKSFSRSGNMNVCARFFPFWLHFSRNFVSIYFATCVDPSSSHFNGLITHG